jgi:hypothetical protein
VRRPRIITGKEIFSWKTGVGGGRIEDARNEFNQSSEALFELSQKGGLDEQGRRWLQEADDQRQHLSVGE